MSGPGVTIKEHAIPVPRLECRRRGCCPCPANTTRDGKTDLWVYPKPFGTWFGLCSTRATRRYGAEGWGTATDIPSGSQR